MICGIGLFLIFKSITAFGGLPINTEIEWPLMIAWHSLLAVLEIGNLYALQIGIITLITIIFTHTIKPLKNWSILLGIIAGTFYSQHISTVYGIENILIEQTANLSVVGMVLPSIPTLSQESMPDIIAIIPGAITIALLGLMQTVAATRRINQITSQHTTNTESIAADSLTNCSLSFLSALPSCASFNRMSVMHSMHAKTRIVPITSAVFLLAFVLFFPELIAIIPVPAMAAVIIIVGVRMIKWSEIRQHFSSKSEGFIFSAAFLSVPVFGLFGAVVFGSLLALLHFNWRKLHPEITVENDVIKIQGSLYYGSLPYVQSKVNEAIKKNTSAITIDLRNASYDDAEAERWLNEIQTKGASKVVGSTQMLSAFMPQSLNNERRRELLDNARFFPLNEGESSTLLADGDNDCIRVISGTVKIQRNDGFTQELKPEKTRGCPCSFRHKGDSLIVHAEEASLICQLDQDEVDFLVSWQELSRSLGRQDSEIERRMDKIQKSLLLRSLPMETLQEAVSRMQSISVKSGEVIIRQWDEGDSFYVIDNGEAEVWREEFQGDEAEMVVAISAGESFGEDALLTGSSRNATIKMITDGILLKLNKKDFNELLSSSIFHEQEPAIIKAMIENGYKLLDVRYEEEAYESQIPNSTLIPLFDLRRRLDELVPTDRYVVYCRSGKRSTVGAMLLSQRGIEAISLKGGILGWPYETVSPIQ